MRIKWILSVVGIMLCSMPAFAENKPKMVVKKFVVAGMWSPDCSSHRLNVFSIELSEKDDHMGDPANKDYSNDPARVFILQSGGKQFMSEVVSASVQSDTLTMNFPEDQISQGKGLEIQPASNLNFQKHGRQMVVSGSALAQFSLKPVVVNFCRGFP